jgi:hypothetical protein
MVAGSDEHRIALPHIGKPQIKMPRFWFWHLPNENGQNE